MSEILGRPVLVTGGAGFIGSHLVEELVRRQARVAIVDQLPAGNLRNLAVIRQQVDIYQLDVAADDLRPLLAERRFEVILHLAGYTDVPESVRNPRRDLHDNMVSTLGLLEAVREASPQSKVLFASSAAVYGDSTGKPFHEEAPTLPVAPYGVHKLAAEHYMNVYARIHGLRTASLRLFPVFGPRLRKQVVYDLLRKVHDNPHELFIYGDGSQIRDFTHVRNIVEAFLLVADRAPLHGEVYNVGSGEPISIGELAQTICRELGAAPRFVYSGDVRPGDAQRWEADISRLKCLGYQARLGFAEGLADTVAWFRQEMTALAPAAQGTR